MANRPRSRRANVGESEEANNPIDDARRACEDLRWSDAHQTLSEIDRRSALAAEDLELLSMAATLAGHPGEGRHALLRAYQTYVGRGELRRAARCALGLGFQQLNGGARWVCRW